MYVFVVGCNQLGFTWIIFFSLSLDLAQTHTASWWVFGLNLLFFLFVIIIISYVVLFHAAERGSEREKPNKIRCLWSQWCVFGAQIPHIYIILRLTVSFHSRKIYSAHFFLAVTLNAMQRMAISWQSSGMHNKCTSISTPLLSLSFSIYLSLSFSQFFLFLSRAMPPAFNRILKEKKTVFSNDKNRLNWIDTRIFLHSNLISRTFDEPKQNGRWN